jgi:hypothetical protein
VPGRPLHFKSVAAYKRYLAYGNIHKVFKHKVPYNRIMIRGKLHKVTHLQK